MGQQWDGGMREPSHVARKVLILVGAIVLALRNGLPARATRTEHRRTTDPRSFCSPRWHVEPVPGGSRTPSSFSSLDGLRSDDVWAAGANGTLHWGGSRWDSVPGAQGSINGIAEITSTDVWAVGSMAPLGASSNRSDGVSWTPVPTPSRGDYSSLRGVDGLQVDDVWAVGYNWPSGGRQQAMALHWNGARWAFVPWQTTKGPAELLDVKELSPADVWAVGFHGSLRTPLALHWDGVAWTRFDLPLLPGAVNAALYSVDGSSSSDIWAVGEWGRKSARMLIEHWDGSAWTLVTSQPVDGWLKSVAVATPTEAIAVGQDNAEPLALRWDGTTWSPIWVPRFPDQSSFDLEGVAYTQGLFWAVGTEITRSFEYQPKSMRLCP
jgi:hypothetical protein